MALNLVVTRVDERLIHGQGQAWIKTLPVNLIVIANDDLAINKFEQDLMLSIIPSSVNVRFFTIQETINKIQKASDQQHIFLLVKTIEDVNKLVQGGVPIKEINLGNVHRKANTKRFSPYVNLTPNQVKILRALYQKGIALNSKQTPAGGATGENIDFARI